MKKQLTHIAAAKLCKHTDLRTRGCNQTWWPSILILQCKSTRTLQLCLKDWNTWILLQKLLQSDSITFHSFGLRFTVLLKHIPAILAVWVLLPIPSSQNRSKICLQCKQRNAVIYCVMQTYVMHLCLRLWRMYGSTYDKKTMEHLRLMVWDDITICFL